MKVSITLFIYLCLFSATPDLFGQTAEPDDLFPVLQNGKWGYINGKGAIIIEPQFLAVASKDYRFNIGWSEGLAPVRFGSGLWGYIDKTGKTVIEPQFCRAHRFSEGLARVTFSENGLVAYINKTGEIIIPPRYCYGGDDFGDFNEGLAFVEIIPGCISFSHSAVKRTEYGFVDKTGKMLLPKLGGGSGFSEGLAINGSKGKFGYMNNEGKMVIEPQFDNAMSFDKNLAFVVIDKKIVYIDKTGKTVIAPPKGFYITCCNYSEGLATVVTRKRKYGYIGTNGQIAIKPRFDGAGEFSEGLAAVNKGADETYSGGKWGYINKTGKVMIDFQFEKVEPFFKGLALVGNAYTGSIGYIDKTGRYIWQPTN